MKNSYIIFVVLVAIVFSAALGSKYIASGASVLGASTARLLAHAGHPHEPTVKPTPVKKTIGQKKSSPKKFCIFFFCFTY